MSKTTILGKQAPGTAAPLPSSPVDAGPDTRYRRRQGARLIPRAAAESPGRALLVAVLVSLLAGALAWWLSAGDGVVVLVTALATFTPLSVLLFFAGRTLAVAIARRGRHQATGTVVLTDDAGHVVDEDAPQRTLVEVEQGGVRRLLVALQYGLHLAVGQRVEVRFRSGNPQVCFVEHVYTATAPAVGKPAVLRRASPSTLTRVVEQAEERGGLDPATEAAVQDRIRSLEEEADRLDRAAVDARIRYDADGRVVQPGPSQRVQEAGRPGRARVATSAFLGETDTTRTFYLELLVTPDSGEEPFDAGMRLVIRKSSPTRTQAFAEVGGEFDVRFDPDHRKQVVLAAHEVP